MRRCESLVLALALAGSAPLLGEESPREQVVAATPAKSCLERWANSTAELDPIDLDQYLDRYGEQYPAAVLKVGAAFFGPVDSEGLEQAFRWSVVSESAHELRLRATPRQLERPALRPSLSVSSADVSPVAFIGEAVRGDFAADACTFELVIDQFHGRPRLVFWESAAEQPRESIERLDPEELVIESGTSDGRTLLTDNSREIQTASAFWLETDSPGASDPAVLEILTRWEQAVAELRSVELKFKRFDRDPVFELETRGLGRFIFLSPDKGLYELKPASVVERADGPTAVGGGRYTVNAAKPQSYWWTGKTVTIVDEREKTFDEMTIPKCAKGCQMQTVGSWDVIWQILAGPQKAIPGVVDVRTEKMINRFRWSVLESSDTRILLEGRPRLVSDRRHMSRLDIILDPKTYRTIATRVIDPAGSRTTDHAFEYVKVNTPDLEDESSWKPDLSGMSPIGPPPTAPPADELPTTPPAEALPVAPPAQD